MRSIGRRWLRLGLSIKGPDAAQQSVRDGRLKVTYRDPSQPSHKATAWQATAARDEIEIM